MVLITVVTANCFPRIHAPRMNMVILKMLTKRLIGIPTVWEANRASPVVPPVISPFGTMNITTARAYMVLPRTICPILMSSLVILFFSSMFLVLSHCSRVKSAIKNSRFLCCHIVLYGMLHVVRPRRALNGDKPIFICLTFCSCSASQT